MKTSLCSVELRRRNTSIIFLLISQLWLVVSMRGSVLYSDDFQQVMESKSLLHDLLKVEIGWFVPVVRIFYNVQAEIFGYNYLPISILAILLVGITSNEIRKRLDVTNAFLSTLIICWLPTLAGAFHTILWPAATWTLLGVLYLLIIDRRISSSLETSPVTQLLLSLLILMTSGPMAVPFVFGVVLINGLNKKIKCALFNLVSLMTYGFIVVVFSKHDAQTGTTNYLLNLRNLPSYILDASSGSAATLMGLKLESGTVVLVFGSIVYAAMIKNVLRTKIYSHIAWLCSALIFWMILALTRGQLQEPSAPRYTIVGAVAFLIVLVDACKSAHAKREKSQVVALTAIATLLILNNASVMEDRTNDFQYLGKIHRAELSALVLFRDSVAADLVVDEVNLPQFSATEFLSSYKEKQFSVLSVDQMKSTDLISRNAADHIIRKLTLWERSSAISSNCSVKSMESQHVGVSKFFEILNETEQTQNIEVWAFGDQPVSIFEVEPKAQVRYYISNRTGITGVFSLNAPTVRICEKQ